MEKLEIEIINEYLKSLNGWIYSDNSVNKVFKTNGYAETLGYVTAIAMLCQQSDHHPDYINMKYPEFSISFSTHSAGGVTMKDIEIAGEIDKLFK